LAYQQPASSTFLSEQTSTSHQPPANRTLCEMSPIQKIQIVSSSAVLFVAVRVTDGVSSNGLKLPTYCYVGKQALGQFGSGPGSTVEECIFVGLFPRVLLLYTLVFSVVNRSRQQ
jgi:hypothetical protein